VEHDTDSREPPAPCEEAAGGVVYRRTSAGVQVIVAEQRDRVHGHLTLRLPKGKLEPGESCEEAALREITEETGVIGRIVRPLDEVEYVYRERRGGPVSKHVRFYLIEYQSGEPRPLDGEMERVFWCTPAEACRRLSFATEQRVMERARASLPDGDRPSQGE
jgi:8-oxo-dGTP pyrophosphatase MutT (NUDIX family)